MMGISHLLDDFSTGGGGGRTVAISDVTLEEHRLEAFENGYKAGWEDAVKAARDDASRVSTDFAGNLQDIAFTLQEAQAGLLTALRPLMTGMVENVLPEMARTTLGTRVIETLSDMARSMTGGPAELVCAPRNVDALQTLVDDNDIQNVVIRAEPSLGEGQVHVRAAGTEQEIDLDAVLSQIAAATTGFFEDKRKDIA